MRSGYEARESVAHSVLLRFRGMDDRPRLRAMRNRQLARSSRGHADLELLVRDVRAVESTNADRVASDRARARYRRAPMAVIEPDATIAPLLSPGEHVHAMRRGVMFELRQPLDEATVNRCGAGDLYLTSRRLVVLSRQKFEVELEWIREIGLAGDRLLLTLADGSGVCVVTIGPRLLRVEISAAREQARKAGGAKPGRAGMDPQSVQVSEPAGGLGPVSDSELVEDAADVTLHRPG